MPLNRRHFIRNSSLLAGMAALSPQEQLFRLLFPASDHMHDLRGGVGYYTERGGTIMYFRNGDSTIVVDTQFPEQSEKLVAAFTEQEGFRGVDLLINTHHHGDHTGGNIVYKHIVGMHVAHENARIWQEKAAIEKGNEDEQLYPEETYTDTWSMLIGGERATLHYFGPGHTGGDSLVHFENANVVHMGDLLFNRRFPNIDRPSGANIHNWIKVLKKARRVFDKDTIFLAGHAAEAYSVECTQDDLKAMENYLKSLLRYVKKEKRSGTSLDQLKEKTVTIPGAPEWKYGDHFRNVNLEVAWAELAD